MESIRRDDTQLFRYQRYVLLYFYAGYENDMSQASNILQEYLKSADNVIDKRLIGNKSCEISFDLFRITQKVFNTRYTKTKVTKRDVEIYQMFVNRFNRIYEHVIDVHKQTNSSSEYLENMGAASKLLENQLKKLQERVIAKI